MRCLVYAAVLLATAAVVPAAAAEARGEPKNEPPFVRPRAVEAPVAPPPVFAPPPPESAPAPPAAAPTPPSAAPVAAAPSVMPEAPRLRVGVNFECNHLPAARDAVMRLIGPMPIRLQVWASMLAEPGYLESLDRCVTAGTHVIVNTLTPNPDPGTIVSAARQLGVRYRGRGLAYEILNETQLSAAAYTAVLRGSYEAVKAADSAATVLAAGPWWSPSSGEAQWLAALYAAGARGFFDAVSVHPYPADLVAPPPSGLEGVKAVRAVMVANGDAKPIHITEYGYSTARVSPEQQAALSVAGVDYVQRELPYVPVVMFFTAYWPTSPDPLWEGTALIRTDYTPTLAWGALRAWTG